MSRLNCRWRRLGVLGVLAVLLPIEAGAETRSTEEFLALRPQWEQMAEKGEPLRVEGRVASYSPRLMRMKKCPLPFRPVEGELPDLRRGTVAVEATGHLGRRGKELVFFVTSVTEPPDDGEVFALKESALDAGDAGDWYALGEWAASRGGFYEDQSLLRKAVQARRRGLALEREAAADDAETLAELAKKADGFGLVELRQKLTHESLRARWAAMREDAKSDLRPLIAQINALLPASAARLAEWPSELAARYAAEPLAVYNGATTEERAVLDRLLFAEVQLAALERVADPQGANGEAIALEIEAALPERPDLAAAYREREIAYRTERIGSSTRSEALGLAKRLEELDRNEEAKRALAAWLAAREAAAREDGTGELVAVAEDYAAVLGDKATAARLLVEVLKETPASEVIPNKLRQLGYVRRGSEWLTKEEAATRPLDPVTQAMQQGRVAAGMSPEQVRKTLGVPDRVARAASTAQVHEAWMYGEGGRGGLVVHFLRYNARGAEEGRVVGVGTMGR